MPSHQELAAANNADWCAAVCACHGIDTERDADAWTARTRAPQLYPDAVTLSPRARAADVVDRIDASEGCSIKDSFASLELADRGFRVLFEAEWIARSTAAPPPTEGTNPWELVTEDGFAAWEQAWRGDDGPSDVLTVDLLGIDGVTILGVRAGDRFVGGAVLYRSGDVVGISNLFTLPALAPASRGGWLVRACELHPGSLLVGYESGDARRSAQALGFEAIGPLRVWTRDR